MSMLMPGAGFLSEAEGDFQGAKHVAVHQQPRCSTPGGPFRSCGGHWSGTLGSVNKRPPVTRTCREAESKCTMDPRIPCSDCGKLTSAGKLAHHAWGWVHGELASHCPSLWWALVSSVSFLVPDGVCLFIDTFSHPNSSLVTKDALSLSSH